MWGDKAEWLVPTDLVMAPGLYLNIFKRDKGYAYTVAEFPYEVVEPEKEYTPPPVTKTLA